jgi:hypothetical protein
MTYGKDFRIDLGPLPRWEGEGWGLSVVETYGYEHIYLNALTEAQAIKLARRVQAAIEARGIEALSDDHWNTRTIYGSRAYINDGEEEAWAWREREDARLGLD